MLLLLTCLLSLSCALRVDLTRWSMQSGDSPAYAVSVPTTVLGGLVANGVYTNVYEGQNLAAIPAEQFDVPWNFTTSFEAPRACAALLQFQGVSYRASVWVNGQLAAASLEGTFVYHDVRFTARSGTNTVVVSVERSHDAVFPPGNNSTDLDITFIDWSPLPPDRSMGLIRPVLLNLCDEGPLLRYPSLNTTVSPAGDALVSISIEVFNYNSEPMTVPALHATLADVTSAPLASFTLAAGAKRLVTFAPLKIASAPLWWPWQLGSPRLSALRVASGSNVTFEAQVGIREVTSGLDASRTRWYAVNGRRVQLRAAGWANELLLRRQAEWATTFLELARHAGLNGIRLEGQLLDDAIFAEADRLGLLVVVGLSCCDAWQHWPSWTAHTLQVAQASVASQARRARGHPSVLALWYSSDELPPTSVEQAYLDVLQQEMWPNPTLSSAAAWTSPLTGPSGVKMSGPYQWVPPLFWLGALRHPTSPLYAAAASGFLSEGGPGAAVQTWQSLQAALGADSWPLDNAAWMYEWANPVALFGRNDYFTGPLQKRYGKCSSAQEVSRKAQVAAYESYRAYFEAYNAVDASFVSWMLQNGRPQNQWHLIEYSGMLGGVYFGARAALAADPHVMLNPVNHSSAVYASSSLSPSLVLSAAVYAVNGSQWWHQDGVTAPFHLSLPPLAELSFVELNLTDAGTVVDRNVYWLPADDAGDVFDFQASHFAAVTQYADLSGLDALAPASVSLGAEQHSAVASEVTVSNPGDTVAFFVRLRLVLTGDQDVLPAFWDDNFITLFPGQSQTIRVEYPQGVNETKRFVTEMYS